MKVPVYNASFKDTGSFKVRLSIAEDNDFDSPRTTIDEVRFENISGWGNGNSRQFAEFTWTPDVSEGQYFLFVDVDPDNEIDENRRSVNGDMIDCGGNNMGYFKVGVTEPDGALFSEKASLLNTKNTSSLFKMSFGSDGSSEASGLMAASTSDYFAKYVYRETVTFLLTSILTTAVTFF